MRRPMIREPLALTLRDRHLQADALEAPVGRKLQQLSADVDLQLRGVYCYVPQIKETVDVTAKQQATVVAMLSSLRIAI